MIFYDGGKRDNRKFFNLSSRGTSSSSSKQKKNKKKSPMQREQTHTHTKKKKLLRNKNLSSSKILSLRGPTIERTTTNGRTGLTCSERRMGRFFGGRNAEKKNDTMNNNKKEVINEHSGLLLNRDQRPVGGRLEYVDLNNTNKNDGKIKPPRRYTKVGNFVLHHHVAKEDLLGATKKTERSTSQSGMNTTHSYPAMMKTSAVVVMSLCFFLVVAAGGTKYVLRSSSNNALNANDDGENSWTRSASVPSSSSRSASSFSSSYSSSKNKNMNALIGLREEPFIDANEKSIASEGVSLDGWFHISASLFVPSSMESSGGSGSSSSSSSNTNDKKAYVFPPALSKPDKNFGWSSEGDLGAKLVSQKGESVARAAFTAHRRTFITDSDLTAIKRSGLTHVRVPITWAMFAEDEEFERGEELVVVDPMYRDRMFIQASREDLREMVKKVKTNDLRVVLALKGMPGGASNDEGDGAWPHEASFFREFSKVLSAEETQEEEEEEERMKSSNESTNRKLLFGGASSGSSSSSNMGSTDGGNKKLVKAKTVAKTGETATANFLNWLANLDDDLKSTVVGVSLIDAPTAKDPKQRAAALTWLERTSQMYRDIIVDPIVEARGAVNKSGKNNNNKKQEKGEEASLPFLHVTMSPTMGIDVDEMAKWMRKTFTTDERSTWAALDVQHAFPRGVGACVGGPSRGCAFSCSDSVEQVARSIGDASDSFARELRSAASEHGVPHVAVSEWSLRADEEGQCPNAGQFLDAAFSQQVRAHRASNVRGYFWRWKSAFDNIENENESMSNQMSRKKQPSSNSLREYLSNRGGKSGIVGDTANDGKNGGKVSTAGWMDEGGVARDDKFDRFKPKDKSIPYDYKTPEEFDDEMQMNTIADDWSSRMTNAIAEAKGTGNSNIMDLLAEEDEGLGTSEQDIETALLNPDADVSVKTLKGFESESEKRKELIDSMKAFGESASRFDSLTSKKSGSSVVDDNDEIFNENGDALKRSMNPFAKPSKLIEKQFSSNSYSGDEDLINPDFRAKKDLGLNELIDGDDGLQKLDEELQESIVDGLAQDANYQLRNAAAKLVNSDSETFATDDDEFNRLLTESETPVMSMPKSQEEREAELLSKKWDSFPEKDGKKPALTILEDGFDPLSMSNDKKLDQVIGDEAKDRDVEELTKKVEDRAAASVEGAELEKTIEKNLANMSKEDLLKLAEQAKLGKITLATNLARR